MSKINCDKHGLQPGQLVCLAHERRMTNGLAASEPAIWLEIDWSGEAVTRALVDRAFLGTYRLGEADANGSLRVHAEAMPREAFSEFSPACPACLEAYLAAREPG
jgi:hypothetical protein